MSVDDLRNVGAGEIEISRRLDNNRYLLHLPSDGGDLPPTHSASISDLITASNNTLAPKHIFPGQKLISQDGALRVSASREVSRSRPDSSSSVQGTRRVR